MSLSKLYNWKYDTKFQRFTKIHICNQCDILLYVLVQKLSNIYFIHLLTQTITYYQSWVVFRIKYSEYSIRNTIQVFRILLKILFLKVFYAVFRIPSKVFQILYSEYFNSITIYFFRILFIQFKTKNRKRIIFVGNFKFVGNSVIDI